MTDNVAASISLRQNGEGYTRLKCDALPCCIASLLYLRQGLDIKVLLLSLCHVCYHHDFQFFFGLLPKEGGLAPRRGAHSIPFLDSFNQLLVLQSVGCHISFFLGFLIPRFSYLGASLFALTSWSVDFLNSNTIQTFSCFHPSPMDRSASEVHSCQRCLHLTGILTVPNTS